MAELDLENLDPGLYHEFVSEINDEEGNEGEIKPKRDWNNKHVPVKLLGYELVEEKEIEAGTTEVTFTELNGDEDKEYRIEGDIHMPNTFDTYLQLKPNGVVTNQKSARHLFTYANGNTVYNYSYLWLTMNAWSLAGDCSFTYTLKAKSGKIRKYSGKENWVDSALTRYTKNSVVGYWGDDVTNITSLVFEISAGSFSGTIQLWKKLPLNIE